MIEQQAVVMKAIEALAKAQDDVQMGKLDDASFYIGMACGLIWILSIWPGDEHGREEMR